MGFNSGFKGLKSIDIGRHGTGFGDTDGFGGYASFLIDDRYLWGYVSNCRSEFIPSLVLVTHGLFPFPSKLFHFYNLPVFHTGTFNTLSHHVTASFSKNVSNMYLKYKKVNVTYKTKLLRAQGTCMHFTLQYLFPSVRFSLYSWYTHSNELTFPCTRITQVTITCYSFYVHCERNRTQGKRMDCYLHS